MEMGKTELAKAEALFRKGQYLKSLELYRIALWYFEEVDDQNQILFIRQRIRQIEDIKDEIPHDDIALTVDLRQKIIPPSEKVEGPIISPEIDLVMTEGQNAKQKGEIDVALLKYNEALKLAMEENNYSIMAMCLTIIAELYRAWGKYDDALTQLKQALQIQEEINDKQGAGQTLNQIGKIYDLWGLYNQSFEYFKKALIIQQKIGDKRGAGESLNDIGDIYREWGQYDNAQYENAFKFYRAALSIHKEIDYQIGVALSLNDIGNIHEKMGQYQEAFAYYKEAQKIQQAIGVTKGLSETLKDIGSIQRKLNNIEEALELHEKALNLAELSPETENLAEYYFEIGLDHKQMLHIDLALQNFQHCLSIYYKILLEMPEEHYKAFAKQITPLLSLIEEIERLAKFSDEELLASIKAGVRQMRTTLLKKKHIIQKNIIDSRVSMIPKTPTQVPIELKEDPGPAELKTKPSSRSIPNQLQETYVTLKKSDFERLLTGLEGIYRIEAKVDKMQADLDKNQILLKLQFFVSNPKELEKYLRKILTSNWSPTKKNLYQETIIEILEEHLPDKWYEVIGKAVAEIAGKVLPASLVDLARLGFGKLAAYLRTKL
jgi:tetratricopeptide (TPR) repeat protein